IKEKISTISNKKNRLKLLFLYSIGANMVDFSTGGHTVDFTKIMQNFLDFPSEGLAINDFKKLYKNYTKANEIIFLSDNCGEIVIDNLIVKQMVEEGKIVYLGLKGAPIANDCMIEDFQEAGLQNYASNLFAVSSAYGWNLHEVTTEFKKLLNNCDLLIVKGQSNFESTLNNLVRYPEKDFPPLYCVLRTKCEVITERLGVPLGSNIIKQMYPLKESEKTTLREIID
ncbi:MAG: ARMT1-like domain-containing protein, partial [Asgard group archaeon]|nr:ARMT1-like domain-containing protein [Asgard group archaeon]